MLANDVTARVRAEELLRRSEARFATLYNAGIVGIAVLDMGGDVLEANDAYLRIIGYGREDLARTQLCWRTLTPPEWKEDDDNAVRAMLQQGSAPSREKEYFRKDGTRVPVLIGSALLEGNQFLSFVLDLTERKRLEQVGRDAASLMEENRRILEASRLKSEFLASMSHELRTPLNAVIGFTDLLLTEEVSPVETHEYLGNILFSGRHLLRLINDVLDLAKVEAGKLEFSPEQVLCGPLVNEVVNVLRPLAAGKQLSVKVWVDPALDGSLPRPGAAQAGALQLPRQRAQVHAARGQGGGAHASPGRRLVAARGRGRRPGDLGDGPRSAVRGVPAVGERRKPFARGNRNGSRLDPQAGRGPRWGGGGPQQARPRQRLPCGPAAARWRPAGERRRAVISILAVDDHLANLKLLEAILSRYGYSVRSATNAAEALRCIGELKPRGILMDIALPGMDGYQLTRKLKADPQTRDIVIVAVTAYAMKGDREKALAAGCDDYISKPIDSKALRAILARRLGGRADP